MAIASTYAAGRALHAPLGSFKDNPGVLANDLLKYEDRIRINVVFKELVKLCEGTGKKLGELLASDTSNLTVFDIIEKLGVPELKGVFTAALKGRVGAAVEQRAAERRVALAKAYIKKDPEALVRAQDFLTNDIPTDLARSYEFHRRTGEAQNKFVAEQRLEFERRRAARPPPRNDEERAAQARADRAEEARLPTEKTIQTQRN